MKKRRCFIIFTPYQLMTCLNIVSQYDAFYSVFYFVNPSVERYQALCEKFGIATRILRELYQDERGANKLLQRFDLLKRLMALKRNIRNIKIEDDIDEMLVPSDDIVCRSLFQIIKRDNKSVVLSLYDDGTGTYGGNIYRSKMAIGNLCYGVCFGFDYCSLIRNVYCYRKNILQNFPSSVSIFGLHNDTKVTDMFCSTDSNTAQDYKDVRVLFLDQGLDFSELYICLKILHQRYKNAFAIKKHPRIKTGIYNGYRIIDDGIPIEAVAAKYLGNECILISHCSGGCISSYIMGGDYSPKVIYLSSLIKEDKWSGTATIAIKKMVSDIKATNIFFPNSVDDFITILDEFDTHINNIN